MQIHITRTGFIDKTDVEIKKWLGVPKEYELTSIEPDSKYTNDGKMYRFYVRQEKNEEV